MKQMMADILRNQELAIKNNSNRTETFSRGRTSLDGERQQLRDEESMYSKKDDMKMN